ncbi:hypothetical protein Y1Q_0006682 [Alligator mississippiensis]|uniref:Uncharacterized protein n=1 Tax=Alligator mississippiensis TaxID=8496 RepID=A0A151NSM7_ALLMI|nr:hypothetical protein Y1Q_0006682 [Alligator mississippiensis]
MCDALEAWRYRVDLVLQGSLGGFHQGSSGLVYADVSQWQGDQQSTMPLPSRNLLHSVANWTTFSRDEGACPHQEPTTQLQWSPTPPFLPKGYTMYSMDRGSTSSNRAVYSLDRTMLSQLDPSIEPGPGNFPTHLELPSQIDRSYTPPVPASCTIYNQDLLLPPHQVG